MDLRRYLCGKLDLWSSFEYRDATTFDVSTVHQGLADVNDTALHETIEAGRLSSWLSSPPSGLQAHGQYLVSRILWIRRDMAKKATHISEKTLTSVLTQLQLAEAVKLCFTAYAGIHKLPSVEGNDESPVELYCFCKHPKVILVWSYNAMNSSIKAVCFATEQQILTLKQLIELQWQDSRMMLPLACATLFSMEIDHVQEMVKEQLRSVEVRTGYHYWASRTESPASGDLGWLSAQMSGAASKLAAVERKTSVIEQVLAFVTRHSDAVITPSRCSQNNPDLDLLSHRVEMQKLDTDFIKRRVDIQLSGLFSLIAQNDAVASHAVARQSKIVAVASQRDSTSMKTLAVVTIFFLPGQVVASVLAMPLFDWTAGQSALSNGPVVNSRFGIYWAITVPLTVFTFIIAAMWLVFEQQRQQHKVDNIEERFHPVFDGSEVGSLVRRRTTVVEG